MTITYWGDVEVTDFGDLLVVFDKNTGELIILPTQEKEN